MTHPLTPTACASIPGATEDVTSRALAAFEDWERNRPPGWVGSYRWSVREGYQTRREMARSERNAQRDAFAHINRVGFPLMTLWTWFGIGRVVWSVLVWMWGRRKDEVAAWNAQWDDDGDESTAGRGE